MISLHRHNTLPLKIRLFYIGYTGAPLILIRKRTICLICELKLVYIYIGLLAALQVPMRFYEGQIWGERGWYLTIESKDKKMKIRFPSRVIRELTNRINKCLPIKGIWSTKEKLVYSHCVHRIKCHITFTVMASCATAITVSRPQECFLVMTGFFSVVGS